MEREKPSVTIHGGTHRSSNTICFGLKGQLSATVVHIKKVSKLD